jgi:hypothetical protein
MTKSKSDLPTSPYAASNNNKNHKRMRKMEGHMGYNLVEKLSLILL